MFFKLYGTKWFLQPSVNYKEANHPLEDGNSVLNKSLMFSDAMRNILDMNSSSHWKRFNRNKKKTRFRGVEFMKGLMR
jgi:bisphosphoglycerate-independent phosphoglycerate mutase (AlkP superfamily)